jgi:hypothetical protein
MKLRKSKLIKLNINLRKIIYSYLTIKENLILSIFDKFLRPDNSSNINIYIILPTLNKLIITNNNNLISFFINFNNKNYFIIDILSIIHPDIPRQDILTALKVYLDYIFLSNNINIIVIDSCHDNFENLIEITNILDKEKYIYFIQTCNYESVHKYFSESNSIHFLKNITFVNLIFIKNLYNLLLESQIELRPIHFKSLEENSKIKYFTKNMFEYMNKYNINIE